MKQKSVLRLLIISFFIFILSIVFNSKPASANVDDFSFSSFSADYYLSKDNDGRSTLRVVEKLTADFENYNQNKGIERAIPRFYDGHSVSFQFESLERNGLAEPIYEKREEQDFIVLLTGTDDYLNGKQEYTFIYTLRDVTKDFVDHQEFYWDTNGTGWNQVFDNLDVRVHLDKSIANSFTGATSCYKGFEGSNTSCRSEIDGRVISFWSDGPLHSKQNLTVNLRFNKGVFQGYQLGVIDIVAYVLATMAVCVLAIVFFIKIKYGKNHPGRGTIVAEYLPPPNVSALLAAEIYGKTAAASTAQILDLAVRHNIRIVESDKKTFIFVKMNEYSLELLNIDGLNEDEMAFVWQIFSGAKIGSKYTMTKADNIMASAIYRVNELVKDRTVTLGYRLVQKKQQYIQIALLVLSVLFIVLSGFAFKNRFGEIATMFGFILLGLVGFIAMTTKLLSLRPLTESGRDLHDYLRGLELYIKLAEEDRIRYLQSPNGAEKITVDINDKQKIVVLYERVLPYAVLFGMEKEWLKQLSFYYESSGVTPGWYVGIGSFNASSFASSVSSFSSYSNSSSSSSSSGSGGGGSSGGGGGGGGGGGR